MSSTFLGSIKRRLQPLVRGAGLAFGALKRLFIHPKTQKERRTQDKANQARVRRSLRGLPSEARPIRAARLVRNPQGGVRKRLGPEGGDPHHPNRQVIRRKRMIIAQRAVKQPAGQRCGDDGGEGGEGDCVFYGNFSRGSPCSSRGSQAFGPRCSPCSWRRGRRISSLSSRATDGCSIYGVRKT